MGNFKNTGFDAKQYLLAIPSQRWFLALTLAVGLIILAAPVGHAGTLGLAWNAPTTNTDGSALTDLSGYRVYTGTSSSVACPGSSYQPVTSNISDPTTASPPITYSVTGLTTGTTYFAEVTAVDTSGNESACSNQATGVATADTTPPTGSLTINSGAAYSPWTPVTLGLTATDNVGVTGYYVSSSATPPAATAAGWVAVTSTTSYSGNVSFPLPSGDGTKTVYAWYEDAAGNVSTRASDSILLDTTPPTNGTLTATAGNAQVALSWSGFADGGSGLASTNTYKLMFSTGGSPAASCTSGTQIYQGTATTYTQTGLTNGTTYYYRVCAFDKAGNVSSGATAAETPEGSGAVSFTFTDDPLVPDTTVIKAVHITELRAAINTLLSQVGLGPFSYTDPTLVQGSTPVKAVHLTDLRTALTQAYQAAGQTPPTYTDPTLVAGQTVIKAIDIQELRTFVRALQ